MSRGGDSRRLEVANGSREGYRIYSWESGVLECGAARGYGEVIVEVEDWRRVCEAAMQRCMGCAGSGW